MNEQYRYLTVEYFLDGEPFGTGTTRTSTRSVDWILEDHARKFRSSGLSVKVTGEHVSEHPRMPDFQSMEVSDG